MKCEVQTCIAESKVRTLAVYLFLSDIFFMTRFYAMSNLVETLLFGLFIIAPSLRSQFVEVLRNPVVTPLILFFGWTLVAGVWGEGSAIERLDHWWSWRKLLLLPIGLILLSNPRIFRFALLVSSSVGLLFFCLAALGWVLNFESVWGRPYTGVLQNPNAQAMYFAILSAGLVITSKSPLGRYPDSWHKLLLAIALLGFNIFLGSSRTGYIASGITLFFIILMLMPKMRMQMLYAVGLMIFFIGMSPFAIERIGEAMSGLAVGLADQGGAFTSGSIRAVFWKNTVTVITDHWLFGTGANGFENAYGRSVLGETGWRGLVTDNPHSQFLHIWAEYGLLGLLMFSWFLIAIYRQVTFTTRWGTVLAAVLAITVSLSFVDGTFGSAVNGRISMFALVICLVGCALERAGKLGEASH